LEEVVNLHNKRILVTGGAGFLDAHVVANLRDWESFTQIRVRP
jgi:nucleoside-diphosphate-sugar epimerase